MGRRATISQANARQDEERCASFSAGARGGVRCTLRAGHDGEHTNPGFGPGGRTQPLQAFWSHDETAGEGAVVYG